MKSDTIRIYSTEAFRLYSRLGKKDEKEIEKNIVKYLEKTGKPKTDIEKYRPLLSDIEAVRKTLEFFADNKKILKNIEDVYFYLPNTPLSKNDITSRIRISSLEEGISERALFLRLKKVRSVFAEKRGLFTGDMPDFMK